MNERKQRPGVVLYFDTLCPALARLNNDQSGALLKGIIEYAMTGAIPELDDMAGMAFDMLRPRIDTDGEHYEDKREQTKYAVYCREAKKRGETPCSFEEWQQMVSCDIGRYPTTTTTPNPTTTPATTPAKTPTSIPTANTSSTTAGAAAGKGETEGCKGDERENPDALHAEWNSALDAGDLNKAFGLSNRLFALGYDADPRTRQMTRRG